LKARGKSHPNSLDTILTNPKMVNQGGQGWPPSQRRKPPTGSEQGSIAGADDLPERWSTQRKAELVLRLLRGEALDAVSRESQVPAPELEAWKRVFLEAGARGLKSRSDPEERELTLARAKIGELMMRLELAEHLIEKS
jgi:transposase